MNESLKILGQISPSANTLTDLYAVPALTSTSVSSIIVCNQNSFPVTFRVALSVAGEAINVKQYLYYDLPLDANDTFIATIGISLGSSDVVRVQSSDTNVSFNLTGVEVS